MPQAKSEMTVRSLMSAKVFNILIRSPSVSPSPSLSQPLTLHLTLPIVEALHDTFSGVSWHIPVWLNHLSTLSGLELAQGPNSHEQALPVTSPLPTLQFNVDQISSYQPCVADAMLDMSQLGMRMC